MGCGCNNEGHLKKKIGLMPRFNKAVEKVYDQEKHDWAVRKFKEGLLAQQKTWKNNSEAEREAGKRISDQCIAKADQIVSWYEKNRRNMSGNELRKILEE